MSIMSDICPCCAKFIGCQKRLSDPDICTEFSPGSSETAEEMIALRADLEIVEEALDRYHAALVILAMQWVDHLNECVVVWIGENRPLSPRLRRPWPRRTTPRW
jgi:hypothetical protein